MATPLAVFPAILHGANQKLFFIFKNYHILLIFIFYPSFFDGYFFRIAFQAKIVYNKVVMVSCRHCGKFSFFILILLFFHLSACQSSTSNQARFVPVAKAIATVTPTDTPLVARVNDEGIALAEYQVRINDSLHATKLVSQNAVTPTRTLTNTVFTGLVEQSLIEQAAARENVKVSDATIKEKIMAMKMSQSPDIFQHWLQMNHLTETTLFDVTKSQLTATALFDKLTQDQPFTADQIHVRIILVTDAALAEDILVRINTGETFSSLAQAYSIDEKTSINGGDLGWFPQNIGTLPATIEAKAFVLPDDSLTDIIPFDQLYYLIKVEVGARNRPLTPQNRYLLQVNVFNRWLDTQRNTAKIERIVN